MKGVTLLAYVWPEGVGGDAVYGWPVGGVVTVGGMVPHFSSSSFLISSSFSHPVSFLIPVAINGLLVTLRDARADAPSADSARPWGGMVIYLYSVRAATAAVTKTIPVPGKVPTNESKSLQSFIFHFLVIALRVPGSNTTGRATR